MFSVNFIFLLNITYVFAIITCLGFLVLVISLISQSPVYLMFSLIDCAGEHQLDERSPAAEPVTTGSLHGNAESGSDRLRGNRVPDGANAARTGGPTHTGNGISMAAQKRRCLVPNLGSTGRSTGNR